MKILILGGYGTFGSRLARLLAAEKELTLFIAGRSAAKAQALCRELPPGARTVAVVFDRDSDVDPQLSAIKPDLVVDAMGPFQFYGENPYRVVRSCIGQGANYMDLADGTQFVGGISQFDDEAKARNLYVLSGVSTCPVLTAAAVRHLSRGLERVTDIRSGIAPSPYAGVGLNVIRAIAAYAGKPVSIISQGRHIEGRALIDSFRYTISPPGCLPLRNRRFTLVDVPDLHLLPAAWTDLESIWFGAGPVPGLLHRMLSALSWLVHIRVLPSLSPFARLFHYATNKLRWGEHRGGMFVHIRGEGHGGIAVERSWHLVAEGDDGPYIPSMPAAAIVRRVLAGTVPAPGARPCVHELELRDYEPLFRSRHIRTGEREKTAREEPFPLYRQILGNAWSSLHERIRAMHCHAGDGKAAGMAQIERGRSWLSTLIADAAGFPKAAPNVPVKVSFRSGADGERWQRTFGRKSFASVQSCGEGRSKGLLLERFGPFTINMALVVDGGNLEFVVRGWSFFGLPLPAVLAPSGRSFEYVADGRFHFDVEIAHSLLGLIVRYRGWLKPLIADERVQSPIDADLLA